MTKAWDFNVHDDTNEEKEKVFQQLMVLLSKFGSHRVTNDFENKGYRSGFWCFTSQFVRPAKMMLSSYPTVNQRARTLARKPAM